MQIDQHTSKQYDAELEQIRNEVLAMGTLVERQLVRAVEALKRQDADLAERVITGEAEVNGKELFIDELCTTLIAKRQPEANDLRLVMTMMKAITDLERIGDESKKIALVTRNMLVGPIRRFSPRIADLASISDAAVAILRRSLDLFASLNLKEALDVARQDLEVDQHFQAILRQLLTYMIEDPRTISASLDIIFVAKSLERIGDHSKNISEYVVYMIKGKDVRHVTLEELEQAVKS